MEGHDDHDLAVENEQQRGHRAPPTITRTASFMFHRHRESHAHLVRREEKVNSEGHRQIHEMFLQTVKTDTEAMDPRSRLMHNMIMFRSESNLSDINESFRSDAFGSSANYSETMAERQIQYRLQSRSREKGDWWNRFFGDASAWDDEDLFNNHFSLASMMVRYLAWTFRTSFAILILQFALSFWIITLVFAGFIQWIALARPECLQVGSLPVPEPGSSHHFLDSYALSWTTFSTVGYGLVYPQISTNVGASCPGITFLTAFEAFCGVLYAAIAGAILFGKISRIQSYANVLFSSPILIRYGPGLREGHSIGRRSFPVLEFRIINGLHNRYGGEICNAAVTCVVAIEEWQASQAIRSVAANRGKRGRRRINAPLASAASLRKFYPSRSNSNNGMASISALQNVMDHATAAAVVEEVESQQKAGLIDEGCSISPRLIFIPLHLETPSHPFFGHSWIVRHTLDATSPLLKNKTKRRIAANGGEWPEDLNSYEKIRDSMSFSQIICSFSGTSNATGSTVYNQKIYALSDLVVGYTFCPVAVEDTRTGKRKILDHLISDVQEQLGGGGEPLEETK